MSLALRGFVALVLAMASIVSAQSGPSTVRPGDAVVVAVAGMADYTTETVVLPDGTITGVGFSRVKVAGLNLEAARKAVESELKKKLKDPSVSFFIKVAAPAYVYVSGLSTASDPIAWAPGLTLRQVLGRVELPADADQLEANLSRGNRPAVRLDLARILQGDAQGGLVLEPGDTLLIAPRPYVRIWVTGFVTKPGQLRVDRGSDVYQAIAAAGGVNRLAAVTANAVTLPDEYVVSVRRGPQRFTVPVRADSSTLPAVLEEGDVVNVEAPGVLRISVGGEVFKPGEQLLSEGSTVESALTGAGGPRESGTLKNVVILRGGEIFSVDASTAASGGKPVAMKLQTGDVLLVRRSENHVYVMGDVAQPGRYIFADNEEMKAADALAKAKGLNARGTNRRVMHVTTDASGKYVAKQFHIDDWLKLADPRANPTLKPGDLLFFGTPKGINPLNVLQFATTVFYFDRILDKP